MQPRILGLQDSPPQRNVAIEFSLSGPTLSTLVERGKHYVDYPGHLIISHGREDREADASFGISGCNWKLVISQMVVRAPIGHLMKWPVVHRETYSIPGEVLNKRVAR